MQSLLRPCCLSCFSSLFGCGVVSWLHIAVCWAAICAQAFLRFPLLSFLPSHLYIKMAWTGSEAELVGDSVAGGESPRAADVELVSSSEAWELVPIKKEVKVETTVDELATLLQSVVNIVEDDVDFSPDPPREAEGETTSNQLPSEPKEPDVSPAADNQPAAEPMTAADTPPLDDTAAPQ